MTAPRPLSFPPAHRVLVIGGGIAGIQAALTLAAMGLPVTLVEEQPSLGGVMAQLDKTFPTNDCAMCILSPRLLEISRHPNIELLTSSRVVHLQGEAGKFQVTVHRAPRYVDPDRCTACGECVRVCPVKVPDPYNVGLNLTKAIRVPFPQAVPLAACIDPQTCRVFQGKQCGACAKVCPAQAVQLTASPEERLLTVGAVIVAMGASVASRAEILAPRHPNLITSLQFERLLSATGPYHGTLRRPSDDKLPSRIAFVQCSGSRDPRQGVPYCSALCCTASLKEAIIAQELTGGNLTATIFYLDLRTPGKNFERYAEQAQRQGVRLCRSRVTRFRPEPSGEITLFYTDRHGRPQAEAFDLVVLAVGLRPPPNWAALARDWDLPQNEHHFWATVPGQRVQSPRPGIFLCGTAQEPMDIAETVTTADAAAAAASQLLTLAPRRLQEVPALPAAAAADHQEPRIGVFLCHCGTNIAGVLDLPAIRPFLEGLPSVVHVEEELFACSLEAANHLAETIRAKHLNRIVVAACTPRTHEPVFREVVLRAGLNPGFVIMANVREQCAWVHQHDRARALAKARELIAMAVYQAASLQPLQMQSTPILPRALIVGGGVAGLTAALNLADQGFPVVLVERRSALGGLAKRLPDFLADPHPQQFLAELTAQVWSHPNITVLTNSRPLRFEGYCGQFRTVVRQDTDGGCRDRLIEHGAVVVAAGGREFPPHGRFLYGHDPRVLTQLELATRISEESLSLPPAPTFIMIQCVGSREPEHPYCSRVCCATAIKNAILVKQRWPLADVVILYRDIRTYGFQEDLYLQAKELGVRFLPYVPERPPQVAVGHRRRLTVSVWDDLLDQELVLAADHVILSAGVEPDPEIGSLAQLFGLPRTSEGFLLEAHQKLKPVESASEGIFLCGLAHSPRTLPETITQAQAAAAAAAKLLSQQNRWSGDVVAAVDPGSCRRCLSCLDICPVGAIYLGSEGKPVVHPHLCQGCGTCVAHCPATAIRLSRCTEAELTAQLQGLLAAE